MVSVWGVRKRVRQKRTDRQTDRVRDKRFQRSVVQSRRKKHNLRFSCWFATFFSLRKFEEKRSDVKKVLT